jgi:hypothetical protein
MWSKRNQTPSAPYPVVGRILNRHKRGRPRFKFLQRFTKKLLIPLGVFSLIGGVVWLVNYLGLI